MIHNNIENKCSKAEKQDLRDSAYRVYEIMVIKNDAKSLNIENLIKNVPRRKWNLVFFLSRSLTKSDRKEFCDYLHSSASVGSLELGCY